MLRLAIPVALLLAAAPLPAQEPVAQEPLVKNRIVSMDLFKNGLAIVKREVKLPGNGAFRLEATPEAVHGTFWIESTAKVEASLKYRDVEEPADRIGDGTMMELFQGKKVTVHFNGSKMPPASGTVPKASGDARTASVDADGRSAPERFFVLKTAKGFMYINPSEIAAVETEEAGEKTTRRRPVLILTAEKGQKAPVVHISYIAHGLAWAPSYLLDVSDPKTLTMEMTAILRNELEDFEGAQVRLISGFPSVEFARVSSPLQAKADWTRFFQELSSRDRGGHTIETQQIAANTTNYRDVSPRFIALDAKPEGEGVDLHYQPVGERSLKRGEALSVNIGKAPTSYERIVEWTVGRGQGTLGLRESGPEDIWDVLHFRNPFPFPLTTAPAMMVEKGRFNGQRTCYWTNVGEETTVKVTRSLSLRTASLEDLDPARQPERVAIGRRDYTRLHLKGELRVNNHRKEKVKLHIHYPIHGQVAPDADGAPRITARPGSLTDVNPIHDVFWVVSLNPGEEKKLGYRYSTLVDR